eukprot:gene12779-14994_t
MGALEVGSESMISFGLISGKILGDYLSEKATATDKISLFFCRRIVTKTVELNQLTPLKCIKDIKDLETLRQNYGLHYISKIEYGSMLDLRITVESSNHETMKQLKGELSGSIDVGKMAVVLMNKLTGLSNGASVDLTVTSSVTMAGCQQQHRVDLKSLDEALVIINNFKTDPSAQVPIRIEVARYPMCCS